MLKKVVLSSIVVSIVVCTAFFVLREYRSETLVVTAQAPVVSDPVEPVKFVNDDLSEDAVEKKVTVVFGGDMMFDRYIRQIAQGKSYNHILQGLSDVLTGSDLAVANLEGPITSNASRSAGSEFGSRDNYIFTFDPIVTDILVRYNFRLVNIGNNHIGNFGRGGIQSTKDLLYASGISYIGDTGMHEEGRYVIEDIDGVRIGFVNYNAFVKDAKEHALSDIAEAQGQSDFVVVYTHWGEEYKTVSGSVQQDLAHMFIDSGAHLIIGSHPHVVQEKEIYNDRTIYYSLGNLVFDQYFSKETKNGLLVKAIFDKQNRKVSFEDVGVSMDSSGKTQVHKTEERPF